MTDLKQQFIARALVTFNTRVVAQIRIAAKRAGVGVTNDAVNSLAFKVFQNGVGAGSTLSFKEYLRMVDMGAGRGHPLGGLKLISISLKAQNKIGFSQVKDNIRKPKKIYSKIAYGNLTGLTNELLYGYTEQAIATLKEELSQNPTNFL
jgi:hypothetical protein